MGVGGDERDGASSGSGYPPPTAGQAAFFEEVAAAARVLEEQACRLTASRRGSPEQVATCFLLDTLRTTLRYVEIARREGRPLEVYRPGAWSTECLVLREVRAEDEGGKVIRLAPRLAERRGAG